MTASNFKDYFSRSAARYAAHRPGYPMALVDALVGLCAGRQLALDCGCGTGQLSVLLAERFERVVAIDASSAQIASASPHDRVTYRTALAEESGLPDGSVDLIAVAQAAHWLDLKRFYDEVRRVARPGAGIALICYGVLHVEGAVEGIVQEFYAETLGPSWPAERRHIEACYRTLAFPFREVHFPTVEIEAFWRLDELLGYIGTWSAVGLAEDALGASPMESFGKAVRQAWGDAEARRRVTWPLCGRVGNV